jgi:glycosyltransferase involved in cell wall biosynthesis
MQAIAKTKMKVVHLPNSHLYHQHLIRALQAAGMEVDLRTWGWGTYLPDVVDEVLGTGAGIVHLHWPEALCRPPAQGLVDRILRRFHLEENWGRGRRETPESLHRLRDHGCKLIWTMHNLAPHNAIGQDHAGYHRLYQQFAQLADGVVHHSRWGEQMARNAYAFRPECRHAIIPFGVFPDEAPAELTQATARRSMDIPAGEMVLLTVGAVGPRKHLDLLAQAVGTLADIPCRLIVVGAGTAETMRQLTAQGKGRVQFLGKLDQASLSRYARTADYLVFAPDRDQLTTGGPHTSESFLRPQFTTANPYVKEVLGTAAIYFEPTVAGLQQALRAGYRLLTVETAKYEGMVAELAERRKAHSWEAAARQTAELYAAVLEPGMGAT